ALSPGSALPASARPFSNRGPAAEFVNDARDFVSRNAGILDTGPLAVLRQHVAVAHPTGLDLDAHLPCARLRNLARHDLEIGSRPGNLGRLHACRGCHDSSGEVSASASEILDGWSGRSAPELPPIV